MHLSICLFTYFLFVFELEACYHGHVGVRGPLTGVNSFLPSMGPKDQTRVIRLGSKCLYSLHWPLHNGFRMRISLCSSEWG